MVPGDSVTVPLDLFDTTRAAEGFAAPRALEENRQAFCGSSSCLRRVVSPV